MKRTTAETGWQHDWHTIKTKAEKIYNKRATYVWKFTHTHKERESNIKILKYYMNKGTLNIEFVEAIKKHSLTHAHMHT